MEREKEEGERRLAEVRQEVEVVLGQVEESSEKISRYIPLPASKFASCFGNYNS